MYELIPLSEYAYVKGGYAFKTKEMKTSGQYPVIKIKNVRNGYLDYYDTSFIDENLAKKVKNYLTKPDDILVTMTGSGPNAPDSIVGRVGRVMKNDPLTFINQRVGRILLKDKNKIDQNFIYYCLSLKKSSEYLVSNSTGSANQANISPETICSLPIPSISYEKSKIIGSFLKKFDEKIYLNKMTNKTLEEIAKGFFKSWFINFDPVVAKIKNKSSGLPKNIDKMFPDSFVNSEIGKIPFGWKVGTIKDIAGKISDKFKKDEDWIDQKLIDLSRMPLNSISLDSYGFGNEISTSACKFKKYDFLFGSIRPYFKKAGICPFSGISNTSVFILRVHKIFDREFLYFYCSSDNIFKKSVQFSDGTKMPIIKWNDFKEFKFALPNEELRNYFSVKINHIIERIIKNNEEQEILKKLRDMLAPKLIYGELKL